MQQSEVRRVIAKKRDGACLDNSEWQAIVQGFVTGTIPEAEMAALMMACVLRGLDHAETMALTTAMIASGTTLKYARGPVVDKHSSGGVGDTVSLLAVPLAAAAGATVAKLSGHALGHTGGTLDKLEALPGVRVDLSVNEFTRIVETVGAAIAAQTSMIVPADGLLYALRDRTATVPSIGLIASSIVSKKIAAGADAIVYDIKMGGGAFMHTLGDARELAQRIVDITKALGRSCTAFITEMDIPLGSMIGSGLESYEALGMLRGTLPRRGRLLELALKISDAMLSCSGFAPRSADVLESGAAYAKMLEMLAAQGGDIAAIERIAPHAQRSDIIATSGGTVGAIDAVALGEAARDLTIADGPYAGLELLVEYGEVVVPGTPLIRVYGTNYNEQRVARAFTLTSEVVGRRPLIYDRVS